jgi:hypothetical protein
MNEAEQRELQRKHAEEHNRVMKRFILWGSVKLLILSAISAAFVYWYMYA